MNRHAETYGGFGSGPNDRELPNTKLYGFHVTKRKYCWSDGIARHAVDDQSYVGRDELGACDSVLS